MTCEHTEVYPEAERTLLLAHKASWWKLVYNEDFVAKKCYREHNSITERRRPHGVSDDHMTYDAIRMETPKTLQRPTPSGTFQLPCCSVSSRQTDSRGTNSSRDF